LEVITTVGEGQTAPP
jgi:hypothetical protein